MIGYLFLAIVVAILIALGVFGPYWMVRCLTGLSAGVKWLVAIFLVETWFMYLPAVPLGIRVYPQDAVFVLLGGCGVLRFFWFKQEDLLTRAWMLLGVVWLGLFVVGVTKFKTVAGVEFRPFFYFWAAAAYFATFKYHGDHAENEVVLWRWLKRAAAALFLIACYRWVSDAAGASNWGVLVGASPFRVLNSSHAHYLSAVMLVLAVHYGNRKSSAFDGWLLLAMIAAVFMLQHRTVWVLAVVTMAVVFVREPLTRVRLVAPAIAFGVFGVVLFSAALAYGHFDTVYASVERSVLEVFSGKGSTISWRVQSWQELLRQWLHDGPLVNLFGYPFGNGWERYVADMGHTTNYSPHSFYVQMLLRGGLVGFSLIGFVYAYAMLWMKRDAWEEGLLPPSALFAIFSGQLVYSITYSPGYMQGVFLGVALSLLSESLRKAELSRQEKISAHIAGRAK